MKNPLDLIDRCLDVAVNHPKSESIENLIHGFPGESYSDDLIQISAVSKIHGIGFTRVNYDGEKVFDAWRDYDVFHEEDSEDEFLPRIVIKNYESGDWEKRVDELYAEIEGKL